MRVLPLFLVCLVVGCGGDDDGGNTPVDGPPIDRPDLPIDAPECGISSTDFGDLGARTGGVATMQGGNGSGLAEVLLPITEGTTPDRLTLDMWGGTQNNPNPIVGGTYELTGIQTAMHTCTVCVAIGAQWPDGGPPNFDFVYMVTGGTATITVDPNPGGAIQFDFTNLTFQHVSISAGVTTPLNDGCVTAIDHVAYQGAFESDSSAQKVWR